MKDDQEQPVRPVITWRQVVPSLFTIAAMLSGFLSMLVTIEGIQDRPALFSMAAKLIMLAMILDGLDGNVARWLKGTSAFGAELDTYVDLTAFGIAPAILIYAVTLQSKDPFWRVLLPSAVALSGMVRLARFKVKDPLRGQGGYAGLPITANAGWIALFVFFSLSPPQERFSLNQGPVATLFLVGIIVFIILQVTNLRYPKPTKSNMLFSLCILLVLLMWILPHLVAARVAVGMLALGFAYVIFGPLFVKGIAVHKARKDMQNSNPEQQ
jgi:CDP-diacylglycerol--serine O-phosphatidyltransferase